MMVRSLQSASLAVLVTVLSLAPAFAGTLRCQSFNGNVTCSGSGAVSCQTINGHTVCTDGRGETMQSFGAPDAADPDDATPPDADADDADSGPCGAAHSVVPATSAHCDPDRLYWK